MRPLARALAALAVLVVLAPPISLRAQALDPAATKALTTTLRMLLDPAQRAGALAGNPQGRAADQQLRDLTRSDALTQEVYALAADVFRDLALASGGDTTKMLQALERGKSDPAGFAAALSPQTLERLRQLAIKISDQQRR